MNINTRIKIIDQGLITSKDRSKAKLKEFLGEWKTMTAIYEFIRSSIREEENTESDQEIFEEVQKTYGGKRA